MTTTFETYTIETEGLMLDRLLWNRFKKRTPGLTERVLDMNRELAENVFLPLGTIVVIPIDAPSKTPTVKKVVRLWGEA
jgi:phage tail protein X